MATRDQHYRYFLTEQERMIIDLVRKTETENPKPLISDTNSARSKEVSIELHVTDGCLGRCVVDSADLIHGFISAGAAFTPSFLEWQHSDDQSDVGYISAREEDDQASRCNHERVPINNKYVQYDDYLSQFGDDETPVEGVGKSSPKKPSAPEATDRHDKKKVLEWSTVMKELIPPEVKHIAFTIGDEHKDFPYEELRTRFPSVQISTEGSCSELPYSRLPQALDKPKVIKEMHIVLNEVDVAANPILKSEISSKYPWASVVVGTDSRLFEHENIAANGQNHSDKLSHLTEYRDQPDDNEFGYLYPMTMEWPSLSIQRKIDIAHARYIEKNGRPCMDNKCMQCMENGFNCKVYDSHRDMSSACQHCRLKDTECSLSDYQHVINMDSTDDQRDSSSARDLAPAESTRSHVRTSTSGVRSARHVRTTASPSLNRIGDGVITEEVLYNTAHRISLKLEISTRKVLSSMLKQMSESGEVERFDPSNADDEDLYTVEIETFYDSLVKFYILCNGSGNQQWTERVLYRFQKTSLRHLNNFPKFTTVETAFRYLPHTNALCETMGTLFAFAWGTEDEGKSSKFMKKHRVNLDSMSRFLYMVASDRDKFTKGLDAEVHRRWCKHHTHKEGDANEKICKKYKRSLQKQLDKAQKMEKKLRCDEAWGITMKYGQSAVMPPGTDNDIVSDSSSDADTDSDSDEHVRVELSPPRPSSKKGKAPQKPGRPVTKKTAGGATLSTPRKKRGGATPVHALQKKKAGPTPALSPLKKSTDTAAITSKKRQLTDALGPSNFK